MNDRLLYSEEYIQKLYYELTQPNIATEGITDTIVVYFKKFIDFIKTIWNKYFGYARRIFLFCKVFYSEFKKHVKKYKNFTIPNITSHETILVIDNFAYRALKNSIEFINSFDESRNKPDLLIDTRPYENESISRCHYYNFLITKNKEKFIFDKQEYDKYITNSKTCFCIKDGHDWPYIAYKLEYLYPQHRPAAHESGGGDVPLFKGLASFDYEKAINSSKSTVVGFGMNYILDRLDRFVDLFVENKTKIDKSLNSMLILSTDSKALSEHYYTVEDITLLMSYINSSMLLVNEYLILMKNFFHDLMSTMRQSN